METRRVTIIRPDNMVIIDGKAHAVDCSGLPSEIQAVQWQNGKGHAEFAQNGAAPFRLNEPIDSTDAFAAIIAAWDAIDLAPIPEPAPIPAPAPDPVLERIRALEDALVAKAIITRGDLVKPSKP